MSRHDHPVRGPQAQSHTHCGDIHQLLDHLGVGAVEGQPVHLHAHDPRYSTPDLVPHQDAQHLLFLEKNEGRDRSGGARGIHLQGKGELLTWCGLFLKTKISLNHTDATERLIVKIRCPTSHPNCPKPLLRSSHLEESGVFFWELQSCN